MTSSLSVKSYNPYLNLPDEILTKFIFSSGNPLIFATCTALNAMKPQIYDIVRKLYCQQHFVRPIFAKIVSSNPDRAIEKIYQIVRYAIKGLQAQTLISEISPFAVHKTGCIFEEISLLSLFNAMSGQLGSASELASIDAPAFCHVMQLDTRLRRVDHLHKSARKVSDWMSSHRDELLLVRSVVLNGETALSKHSYATFKGDPSCKKTCEMSVLPEEISFLKQLRVIRLVKLNLISVSNEIGSLPHLEELDLSENNIRELPISVMFLQNLQKVRLDNNNFTQFPFILCYLRNMRHLNLSHNRIRELPVEISAMQDLQSINLSYNHFTEFPDALELISSLQVINLSNNMLRTVPSSIDAFAQLQDLDISDNPLEMLPGGALFTLATLQLRHLEISRAHLKLIFPEAYDYLKSQNIIVSYLHRSPGMENIRAHSIV